MDDLKSAEELQKLDNYTRYILAYRCRALEMEIQTLIEIIKKMKQDRPDSIFIVRNGEDNNIIKATFDKKLAEETRANYNLKDGEKKFFVTEIGVSK